MCPSPDRKENREERNSDLLPVIPGHRQGHSLFRGRRHPSPAPDKTPSDTLPCPFRTRLPENSREILPFDHANGSFSDTPPATPTRDNLCNPTVALAALRRLSRMTGDAGSP